MKIKLAILFLIFINCHLEAKEVVVYYTLINFNNAKMVSFMPWRSSTFWKANKINNKNGVYKVYIDEPEKLSIIVDANSKTYNTFWVDDKFDTVFVNLIRCNNQNYIIEVKNSPINNQYIKENTLRRFYENKQDSLSKLKLNTPVFNRINQEIEKLNSVAKFTKYGLFIHDCNSFLGLDNLHFFLATDEISEKEKLMYFNCLDTSLKKYPLWMKCDEFMHSKRYKYKIGDTLQPNVFYTKDSSSVAIDTLIHKNKYTYVFIWSTGCHSTYEFIPKLGDTICSLYKNKLEIIGVSKDVEWQTWKNTISQTQMPWINICDFKGYLSPISYGISSSHAVDGILLDENKKIIAINLQVKDLDKYLKGLIK